MELRLAYRIMSFPPRAPHPQHMKPVPDPNVLHERLKAEAVAIGKAEKFDFSNIAEYFASHPQFEWTSETDIPNWAPPFSHFFVEWQEPKTWNIRGEIIKRDASAQLGVHVMAFDVRDEWRGQPDMWVELVNRLVGGPGVMDEATKKKLITAIEPSRWVLFCSTWLTASCQPICGHPMWPGNYYFLFVKPDGSLFDKFGVSFTPNYAENQAAFWTPINILGLGLSFCHCKNVAITEQADRRPPKWHARTGVPILKFRTLNINPMREVLRREGRSEEVGLQRALHICRGHFATYTEEHPLFGKYVGTFFRPSHVRGASEAGVIVKDYKPGTP